MQIAYFASHISVLSKLGRVLASLCLAFGLSVGVPASSAPANPHPIAFKQPDGTVIQVHLKGDEFLNWAEDAAGNLIALDQGKNGFCYANWTSKGPASTGELAVQPTASISFSPGIWINEKARTKGLDIPHNLLENAREKREKQNIRQMRKTELHKLRMAGNMQSSAESLASSQLPSIAPVSTLKRNVLMIHVTWSDRTGINTPKLDGNQIYNLVFNPSTNSVNKYYKEMLGTAEDIILPATVNNALNDRQGIIEVTLQGRHPGFGNMTQYHTNEPIIRASANGHINFSDYDANGNGVVEPHELSIGLIFDGYERSAIVHEPSTWGGVTSLAIDRSLTNNVRLDMTFIQSAFHRATGNSAEDMLTVGIVCHELGHSEYGFVDTYGGSPGHGAWSLMAHGIWAYKAGEHIGTTPSYVDAFNLTYCGFVAPGVITASQNNITANSHLDIYRVDTTATDKQYFLLQQRKFGTVDNFDRGAFYMADQSSNSAMGGLLIYHVDENAPNNNKYTHMRSSIEEAHGGLQHLPVGQNSGDLNDLWGNSKKLFSQASDPPSTLYSTFTNNAVPPSQIIDSGIEISNVTWSSGAQRTSFNVGVTEVPAGPYNEISATSRVSFPSLPRPYALPVAQIVTITNNSQDPVTLTQPTAAHYDIGPLSATVLATKGATATLTIRPKASLPIGVYDETITIRGTNWAIATTYASFSVVGATTEMNVSNFGQLQSAVNSYESSTGNIVINVTAGFLFTDMLWMSANPYGAALTIRGTGPENSIKLMRGGIEALFYVDSGAKLIMENIVADGNKGNPQYHIYPLITVNGGEFTMNSGKIINNNADFGGVSLWWRGGVFTLNGGEISGNSNSLDGGGVEVTDGQFIMAGGKINANTARAGGGVYAKGEFIMTGGEISGNTAGYGGGVYTCREFIMTGGEISGNNASDGGGVKLYGDSFFSMAGGEISNNFAGEYGGGVSVERQHKFTMTGGRIFNNIASVNGGGVFSSIGGELTVGGTAAIYSNTLSGAANNVDLPYSTYIALSKFTPPAAGMFVGVTTPSQSGIIVNSGAMPGDEQYFFSDIAGRSVVFENNQLLIKNGIFIDGITPTNPSFLGFANAYGSTLPADLAKYDLNRDGKIDDEDIRILFRAMGWL